MKIISLFSDSVFSFPCPLKLSYPVSEKEPVIWLDMMANGRALIKIKMFRNTKGMNIWVSFLSARRRKLKGRFPRILLTIKQSLRIFLWDYKKAYKLPVSMVLFVHHSKMLGHFYYYEVQYGG